MKNLLLIFSMIALLSSCSNDELELQTNGKSIDLSYLDESNFGKYKGVFTTNDGDQRATVEINLVSVGKSTAALFFPNGNSILFIAEVNNTNTTSLDDILFTSKHGSFETSISNNGKVATISEVIFNNKEGDILIAKETSKAPLATFSGTYICSTCSNSTAKTFNVIVSGDGTGNQNLTTQMVFNSVAYAGIGLQDNCTGAGPITFCNAESGDGITPVGFSVGASEVEWQAEMIYSNFGGDCSELSGAWVFRKGLAGEKTGTFRSDAITNCLTELAFEDFEDAVVTYTTSTPEFTDGFGDYFLRTDGSNIGGFVQFSNIIGASYFAAQDVDGEGATLPAYVTFEDLNVSSLDAVYLSAMFAEDDDGLNQDWDNGDNVIVEFSFDGIVWIPFFAIEGDESSGTAFNSTPRIDTNLDGIGNGAEITNVFQPFAGAFLNNALTNPTSSPTVSVRIAVNLNSGDEDIAFDNILIRGL